MIGISANNKDNKRKSWVVVLTNEELVSLVRHRELTPADFKDRDPNNNVQEIMIFVKRDDDEADAFAQDLLGVIK